MKKIGRRQWKKESGFHRQGTVENAFFRYKSILPVGQNLGNDHTRVVDTEMELHPASFPLAAMLCGSPFALADDREPRAVDDEMDASPS